MPTRSIVRLVRSALLAVCCALPAVASAEVFTVDTTLDDVTKSACDDEVDADCSLRGAIAKANAAAALDTIMVPAGTFTFASAAPCTFLPHAGDPVYGTSVIPACINSDVDIVGAGAAETIIQSNGADRLFAISKSTTVTMRDLTLNGGRALPGFGYAIGGGGAINAQGTLTLTDMVVQNHQALGTGGAILNRGTLTIVRSTFADASTPQGGGMIAHYGALLTIIDSSFTGGGAHNGGVIAAGGEVVISGSTFSGNNATVGGVLFLQGGPATILSSTLSGNGGTAIDVGRSSPEYGSTLHVVSSTVTKNSGYEGGGMYVTGNQHVYVRNSIFADNTSGFAPDAGGKFTSEGYNLFGTTQNSIILGDTSTNVTGVAARLAPLSDNGGPTRTHAPLPAQGSDPASPAIDAGNPATPGSDGFACPGTDQRGVLRPIGVRCDIGAVERAAGLSLVRIAPTRAGAVGPLAAVIVGNGFDAGATVTLTRAGQPDVPGAPVTVGASGGTLAASFDVAGRALGAWDVVVTNPDGSSTTLPAALTLEETRAPKLWADIVGKSAVRVGAPVRYSVIYGNRGNVDAVGVPLSIVTPKNFVFEPIFPLTTPPAATGLTLDEFGRVRIDVFVTEESEQRSVPLILPIVPAGFTGTMDFIITLPPNTPHGSDFGLEVKIEPEPWLASAATLDAAVTDLVARGRAYAERGLGTPIPANVDAAARLYAQAQLEAIATAGRNELVTRLGQAGSVYSVAQMTIDVAAYMQAQALAASTIRTIADTFLTALGDAVVATACADGNPCPRCICGQIMPEGCSCSSRNCEKPYQPDDKPPKPGDPFTPADCREIPNHKVSDDGKSCIPINTKNCGRMQNIFYTDPDCIRRPIVNSVDPNDKYASSGSGETHAVTGDEPLKYAIAFENLPAASAPAQTVVVTDQLDTASLDLSTFAFGPIAIGADITIVPPPGLSDFTGGAELPEQNVVVTVVAHLDHETGVVTWTFGSLDPATRQPTDDALAGFLPPNTSPPAGEGRVFFTVGVKPTVGTGTVITNQASIVFDVNEAIVTPVVSNVVDKTAPESAVTQITPAAACGDTQLTVAWGGTDEGSAIRDFDVFVSENGGPATIWRNATTETSATLAGVAGTHYAFHTIARDAVDNTEEPPATADVTYTVVPCGGDTTTTSTTVGGTTTTTTLPDCAPEASFDGVACRIATLRSRVGQLGPVKIGKQLDKTLRKASTAVTQAQAASGKKRVKQLRKATKAMTAFRKKLASKAAVKAIDATTRSALASPIDGILTDLAGLATP